MVVPVQKKTKLQEVAAAHVYKLVPHKNTKHVLVEITLFDCLFIIKAIHRPCKHIKPHNSRLGIFRLKLYVC